MAEKKKEKTEAKEKVEETKLKEKEEGKDVKEKEEKKEVKEEAEATESAEEAAKFPFPRSVVVRLIRGNIDKGKQIKGRVKDEMNWWLGDLVKKLAGKMNAHPYSYVDYGMFKDAISTYEKMEEIEHEKERIIKHLEQIKADIEMLEREVEKKFSL